MSIDLRDLRGLDQIASRVGWELMRLQKRGAPTEDRLKKIKEGIELIQILKTAAKASEQITEGVTVGPDDYQAYFTVRRQFFGEIDLGKINCFCYREVHDEIHKLLARELRKPLLKILEKYEGVAEKLQKLLELEDPQNFSKDELDTLREQFATLSLLLDR